MSAAYGTYVAAGDGPPALRFERTLPFAADAVWRAVSDPAELRRWFPQEIATLELREGADVGFRFAGEADVFDTGSVVAVDPPRLLAFTWFGEELRFEVEPAGADATTLRFGQLVTVEPPAAARNMAGWHTCLDVLERALALGGDATPEPASFDEWRAHYAHYVAAGVPHGAFVPGLEAPS